MSTTETLTITYSEPDEGGWIIATITAGDTTAASQGRTRDEARAMALDALVTTIGPLPVEAEAVHAEFVEFADIASDLDELVAYQMVTANVATALTGDEDNDDAIIDELEAAMRAAMLDAVVRVARRYGWAPGAPIPARG